MAESLTQLRKKFAEQAIELSAINHEPRGRTLIIEKLAELDKLLETLLKEYHLCPQELEFFSERRRRRAAP